MRYLQFILLLLPLSNYAQEFQLMVNSRSGYEYNPFNQPILSSSTDTSANSVASGVFQQFLLQSNWKKTIKTHQLSWNNRGRVDHFWDIKAANLFRWETGFGYGFQWNKYQSLQMNLKYLIYQTNRVDNGTAVFIVPSSYHRWSNQIAYRWRPAKNNKSLLSTQFTKKNYAALASGQLQYSSIEGIFQTTQKFKRNGKKSSYLSWEVKFQQRNYNNSPVAFFVERDEFDSEAEFEEFIEEAEWEIEDLSTFRRWQYVSSSLNYAVYLNKSLKITTGLRFQKRKDIWDARFGYRQMEPFLNARWTKNRWQVRWKTAMVFRQFSDLFADENEDYLLHHFYLRNSVLLTYEINKSWKISAHLNIRKRWRNQPEMTTNNYLPYLTGLGWIGIQYRWNKK